MEGDTAEPSCQVGRRAMSVQPVSQLTPCSVSRLWPSRLALGKLATLDGDPDLGKSLVTLDLCTRPSRGLPFPDGSPSPGPANAPPRHPPGSRLRPQLARL